MCTARGPCYREISQDGMTMLTGLSDPGGEFQVAAAFEIRAPSQRSDLKSICQLQFFVMLYFEIYGGLSKGLKETQLRPGSSKLSRVSCYLLTVANS